MFCIMYTFVLYTLEINNINNNYVSEYDALAKVIQQHPDRQETLKFVISLTNEH